MVEMERIIEPMGKVPLKRGGSVTCDRDEPKGNLSALAHLVEAFSSRSLPTFASSPCLVLDQGWMALGEACLGLPWARPCVPARSLGWLRSAETVGPYLLNENSSGLGRGIHKVLLHGVGANFYN